MKRVTRRSVVAAIGAAGTGACVCGLKRGCATFSKKGNTAEIDAAAYSVEGRTVTVSLEGVPSLSSVGGSVKIIDARLPTPLIIARTGERTYAAVSLRCPHRGVEVEYRHAEEQFRCASLGHSKFGLDGSLIKGFTKKGLVRYVAALDSASASRLLVLC